MKYTVKLTPHAIAEISETIAYISHVLLVPDTARAWADHLQSEISGLDTLPVSSSGKRTVAQARNSKNAREKLYRLLLCGSGKQDGMDHGNGLCKTRPAQRFEKYAAFIIRQTASATFCGCCLFLYPSPGNDHVCTGQLFIWCDNF